MYVLFYFISNLILIAMFVVYLFLLYFEEAEPLHDLDNLDSDEKTLMTEVMVIEDNILLEQTGKLVLRIFFAYHDKRIINSLYFLDKPSKYSKIRICTIYKIPSKTSYEPSKIVSSFFRYPSRTFLPIVPIILCYFQYLYIGIKTLRYLLQFITG